MAYHPLPVVSQSQTACPLVETIQNACISRYIAPKNTTTHLTRYDPLQSMKHMPSMVTDSPQCKTAFLFPHLPSNTKHKERTDHFQYHFQNIHSRDMPQEWILKSGKLVLLTREAKMITKIHYKTPQSCNWINADDSAHMQSDSVFHLLKDI